MLNRSRSARRSRHVSVDSFRNSRSRTRPYDKRQLAKSGPAAANYRASRRSRSHAEFTSRIAVVAEEADRLPVAQARVSVGL
jgi:hypothetical protein